MIVEPMRIPVFVSCPSDLSDAQLESAEIVKDLLDKNKLAWRALGRSDYSYRTPLTEVLGMVSRCSGGVILGFTQFEAPSGVFKPNSTGSRSVNQPVRMATPWNQLETGIIFSHGLPILVFKEEGISGGVFDIGTQDVYVNDMPSKPMNSFQQDRLETLFQNWAADVKHHYYAR
jgi:hypothetical protein